MISTAASALRRVAVNSDRIGIVGVPDYSLSMSATLATSLCPSWKQAVILHSHLGFGLLLQRILGDCLECLLDVDGLLGARLKVRNVTFTLAPCHGPLLRHHPLGLFDVNLVAQHDEGEVLGIMRTGLDQELVSPGVERLKRLGTVNVVYQHAAIGTAVKGHPQRLEALLPCRVPELLFHRPLRSVAARSAYENANRTGG